MLRTTSMYTRKCSLRDDMFISDCNVSLSHMCTPSHSHTHPHPLPPPPHTHTPAWIWMPYHWIIQRYSRNWCQMRRNGRSLRSSKQKRNHLIPFPQMIASYSRYVRFTLLLIYYFHYCNKISPSPLMKSCVYVTRKPRIHTILGWFCAKLGS